MQRSEAKTVELLLTLVFQLSDFMYLVPNIPHLKGVQISVEYRELATGESTLLPPRKWKADPGIERFCGFAPRHKYYVNGVMVREEMPTFAETSKTPFPERRVPRRGLVQVFPDDPDYVRICLEQGLDELVKDRMIVNGGTHSSPANQSTAPSVQTLMNGTREVAEPESGGTSHAINGGSVNGVYGGH